MRKLMFGETRALLLLTKGKVLVLTNRRTLGGLRAKETRPLAMGCFVFLRLSDFVSSQLIAVYAIILSFAKPFYRSIAFALLGKPKATRRLKRIPAAASQKAGRIPSAMAAARGRLFRLTV